MQVTCRRIYWPSIQGHIVKGRERPEGIGQLEEGSRHGRRGWGRRQGRGGRTLNRGDAAPSTPPSYAAWIQEPTRVSSPTPRWMGNCRATLRVVGCRRLKKGSAALGDDWKGREQGRSTWEEDG